MTVTANQRLMFVGALHIPIAAFLVWQGFDLPVVVVLMLLNFGGFVMVSKRRATAGALQSQAQDHDLQRSVDGIVCDAKGRIGFWWLISLGICGLAAVQIPNMLAGLARGELVALPLILLLGCGALVLTLYSIVVTLRWRRFGNLVFRMDPCPAVLGGRMAGTIDVPLPFNPQQVFRLELNCVSVRRGEGQDNSRSEYVVWTGRQTAVTQATSTGTQVTADIRVPNDHPHSSLTQQRDHHLWRLHVRAYMSGVDLDYRFEVPVREEQMVEGQLVDG